MPAFRDISVKYKITAISLLTSCVVLALASVVFVGVEWMSDRRAIGQELETIAAARSTVLRNNQIDRNRN